MDEEMFEIVDMPPAEPFDDCLTIRTVADFPDLVEAATLAIESRSGHAIEAEEDTQTLLRCYLVAEYYGGHEFMTAGTYLQVAQIFEGYPDPELPSAFGIRDVESEGIVVSAPGFFIEEEGYYYPDHSFVPL